MQQWKSHRKVDFINFTTYNKNCTCLNYKIVSVYKKDNTKHKKLLVANSHKLSKAIGGFTASNKLCGGSCVFRGFVVNR